MKNKLRNIAWLLLAGTFAAAAITAVVIYVFVGDDAGLDPFPDLLYIRSGSGVPGCELAEQSCVSEPVKEIGAGKYLIFSNKDDVNHTMTSGTPESGPDGEFDIGPVPGRVTQSFIVPERGEYDWFCWSGPPVLVPFLAPKSE